VTEKKCFKCLTVKPLSEFYRHRMMADGHLSKCAECARRDVAEHREKHIERIREYDRDRSKLPHRADLRRRVLERLEGEHPERRKAAHVAGNAERDGKLTRPDACEGCATTKRRIEKHHPDYSKPLLVVWLCKPCHAIADKIRRRLEAS
jgi:hypothetical protein